MMKAELWADAGSGSIGIETIEVTVDRLSNTVLRFQYVAFGCVDAVIVPAPAAPVRANNLWQRTCFEAFLAPRDLPGYLELNFSPSGQWAAYDFAAYRAGRVDASLPGPPTIETTQRADRLELVATISLDLPYEAYRLGLSAVIEEGTHKSYWALNHPGGADFHHPTCFALELPSAPQP